VPWRGHSNLKDGCLHQNQPNLSGGFYDSGDTMKYHMVSAAALTQPELKILLISEQNNT